MNQLLHILANIILPVLIMASAGFILRKAMHLDITVFSKALFYIILPSLIFTKIYSTELSAAEIGRAAGFVACIILSMFTISQLIAKARGFSQSKKSAFELSTMYYNSGNYGLPVIELVFNSNPFATAVQVIVITTQNIFNFTLGIFLVSRGKTHWKTALGRTLRYPMIYAIVLGLLLRGLHIDIWEPIWIPLEKMGSALVPMALFSLGAQLANVELVKDITDVVLSAVCRLVAAPVIAYLLILLFGLSGIVAQVLLISSSMPTAVNTALIAIELDNRPDFASQAVFLSTICSIITVTATVYFAMTYLG